MIKPVILLILKGMAMGIAEVIPGVSGGTIAFITGIYEKLIESIKAFHPRLFKLIAKAKWAELWESINGRFLSALLLGMVIGIGFGILVITHFLESDPETLWGFFFGLILASAFYVGFQLSHWKWPEYLSIAFGFVLALMVTILNPAEGSSTLPMIFIAGFIAISAMILPGISGSFILLLMGMYTLIIPSVKTAFSQFETDALTIVAVFGVGCIIGLATFSRVLSWTFKHYKNQTLALLTGFMLGSLNKIWPWRNPDIWVEKSTGNILLSDSLDEGIFPDPELFRLVKESNVLPFEYGGEPKTFVVGVAFLFGLALVYLLAKKSKPLVS